MTDKNIVTSDMLDSHYSEVDYVESVECWHKFKNGSGKFSGWSFSCHSLVVSDEGLKEFKRKGKWAVGIEKDGIVTRYPLKKEFYV